MNTLRRLGAVAALAILAASAAPANAALLTYFNFNDANASEDTVTGGLPTNGDPLVSNMTPSHVNPVTEITFVPNTNSVNKHPHDPSADTHVLQVSTGGPTFANEGKAIQFFISTVNWSQIVLSYATRRDATGFNLQTLSYSVDGFNFTNFATAAPPNSTTFQAFTFNVSALTHGNVDNQGFVILRWTFSGASIAGGGTGFNMLDNIQVTAVPEPATILGGLLGVAGLCFHQRRRLLGKLKLT